MPLASRFAERLQLFGKVPMNEFLKKFSEVDSVYVSPDLEIKEVQAGDVPLLTYRPTGLSGEAPALIWMHGGGFQQGTYTMIESHVVSQEIAHRGQMVVINVEYRLVNETVKFPAPQEDCYAALEWVAANAAQLGVRSDAIFIGGISAGGCLAASVSVMDRQRGTNYLKGQLLNCPILHKALPPISAEIQSKLEELNGFYFHPEEVTKMRQITADGGDPNSSPNFCWPGDMEIFSDLPVTQIINCEYDSLRASGEKYGEQLKAAGVKSEVITQAGMPHAYINNLPADLPEVGVTMDDMVRFIKENS